MPVLTCTKSQGGIQLDSKWTFTQNSGWTPAGFFNSTRGEGILFIDFFTKDYEQNQAGIREIFK